MTRMGLDTWSVGVNLIVKMIMQYVLPFLCNNEVIPLCKFLHIHWVIIY